MRLSIAVTVMIAIPGTVAPLCAQVLEAPARTVETPQDPAARTHHEVSVNGNFLGGFDDNLATGSPTGLLDSDSTGATGFGDLGLRYWFGKSSRSLDVTGRGFVNAYQGVDISSTYGGELTAGGRASLSRRASIDFTQVVRNDPYLFLGLFGPLSDELGSASPDANTSNGDSYSRSWSVASTAHATGNWTRATRTDAHYTHSTTTYDSNIAFDTRTDAATGELEQSVWRTGSIRATYRYIDNNFTLPSGITQPMLEQGFDVGYQYSRQLSRTRGIAFSLGGGRSHVSTIDVVTRAEVKYWSPAGYGSFRYDFGRTWNVSADFRRSVSVLQQITPAFYNSDAATLRTGGSMNDRFDMVFVVGYANGQAGVGAEGRYVGYTGTTQLRYQLTRTLSSSLVFNHYQYRFSEAAAGSLGVSPETHRSTLLAGFNWTLPIVGPRRRLTGN